MCADPFIARKRKPKHLCFGFPDALEGNEGDQATLFVMPTPVVPAAVVGAFSVTSVAAFMLVLLLRRMRMILRSWKVNHGCRSIKDPRRLTVPWHDIYWRRVTDDDATREQDRRCRQSESNVEVDVGLGCDSGSEQNG